MPHKIRKVAFVATVYRHLEAFHIPYIKFLQEKGFEVHAYGAPDHGKDGIVEIGVVCHEIPFSRNPMNRDNIRALKELTNSFKKEGFDLIHVHTPVASIIARIAAKKAKVPRVIYTAHGFHFFDGAPLINWMIYYPVERIMARYTDTIVTINEEDFKRAQSFSVRDSIQFVPGVGVNTKQFILHNESEIQLLKRNELKLNEKDFVILCVAELNDNKNHKQLLEAMNILRHKYENIKCLIVGMGEDYQSLQDEVNQLDLNKIVKFLGFRKDIVELLAISSVVTLFSKREGLPKALLEALAAAKPIIATDVRGNRDLVIDGKNGYLVPVSDVNKTVQAFEKLIDKSVDALEMGNASLALANKYDLDTIMCQMDKIYTKSVNLTLEN
ncbi:glycosyltransferase family 4 protein [Bacillus paranthracis]|uniref:glycosyltransferase family 4 protein n=1 Tax=Bacillus paranthracis TaxID=2026186 RepID=UPI0013D60957|nr:glycosyltransferase family 4 protein [Bacillus paranthracis]MDR0169666.1 glycosyltransferase family 4 protein [Bacillus paranthracis]QRH08299.1 glycosyltransferase family 4 protein [Bacillus paranthracis]